MDSLTAGQLADYQARYPKTWAQKYNARNQRYDIIEVHPDGFYQDTQHGGGTFIIIHVPGISVAEGLEYTRPITSLQGFDEDGQPVMRLERKYGHFLKFANLPANIRNKLNNSFVHTVTLAQWEAFKAYIERKVL